MAYKFNPITGKLDYYSDTAVPFGHTALLDMPSAVNADHDGRYYTEAEVNAVLAVHTAIASAHHAQAHATSHTDGTDDIQSATTSQKGVATTAQINKLDGNRVLAMLGV